MHQNKLFRFNIINDFFFHWMCFCFFSFVNVLGYCCSSCSTESWSLMKPHGHLWNINFLKYIKICHRSVSRQQLTWDTWAKAMLLLELKIGGWSCPLTHLQRMVEVYKYVNMHYAHIVHMCEAEKSILKLFKESEYYCAFLNLKLGWPLRHSIKHKDDDFADFSIHALECKTFSLLNAEKMCFMLSLSFQYYSFGNQFWNVAYRLASIQIPLMGVSFTQRCFIFCQPKGAESRLCVFLRAFISEDRNDFASALFML